MDDAALAVGVEDRTMGGLNFKVFSIAKTVADCFKYRNKIGLDVAIEALQVVIRERRATPSEIMQYAQVLRVDSVMAPYIQALM